jgi:hypothetical protein
MWSSIDNLSVGLFKAFNGSATPFTPYFTTSVQKHMVLKKGRYRIDLDVLLFPWMWTYKTPGSGGHVPKGSFGKVHLAQDTVTRKRMACKRVSQ